MLLPVLGLFLDTITGTSSEIYTELVRSSTVRDLDLAKKILSLITSIFLPK